MRLANLKASPLLATDFVHSKDGATRGCPFGAFHVLAFQEGPGSFSSWSDWNAKLFRRHTYPFPQALKHLHPSDSKSSKNTCQVQAICQLPDRTDGQDHVRFALREVERAQKTTRSPERPMDGLLESSVRVGTGRVGMLTGCPAGPC